MKISYDKDADALYIEFRQGQFLRRTVQASPDVNLDFGPDERLAGVELLGAGRLLSGNGAPQIELQGIEALAKEHSAEQPTLTLKTLRSKWKSGILRLAQQHGMRNVRVFGSSARGEENAESDLDLLVEVEPGRDFLDLIGFEQDVGDLVGRKVDVLSDGGVSPYMREGIYREAVPL